MPISFTDVKDKELLRKAALRGVWEYVHVKFEPSVSNRLPFPSDYEFSSCFLPKKYPQIADQIFNFKVRPDDVWVISFPKSGSTWLSNIVWQLQHNLDFSAELLAANYNYLEKNMWYENNEENINDPAFQEYKKGAAHQLDRIAEEKSPRLIKSHLVPQLLPISVWTAKPKLIYVYRNAKDVAVSYYHMVRNTKLIGYKGSMEDCFDSFLSDHVVTGPFHSHVKSYRQLNQLDHILIMTYEEMLANPFAEIKRISEFLEFSYSDDQLKQLTEYVSFQNMRAKKDTSPFQNRHVIDFLKKLNRLKAIVHRPLAN